MLLRDVVFSVRNVEFETFRPWIDFILRVVNDGAPCEAQDRLLNALTAVINSGPLARGRRGAGGLIASVQFQNLVRRRVEPTAVSEHLSPEDRESFFNREVYRQFVQSLPAPSYSVDERGRVVLRAEAPPVLEGSASGKKRFLTRKSDAERIAEPAMENELKCHAVICALGNDRLAQKLFRCAHCNRFFLARAAHRRTHNFCRPEHRRAYDKAHRDPNAMAAYMRGYRKKEKERERRKVEAASSKRR